MKTLHGVFQRPGPLSVGSWYLGPDNLEAMSLDSKWLRMPAESSTSAFSFTLTSACPRSSENPGGVIAIKTSFCKQTLYKDIVFDATMGKHACVRVKQSHFSISRHIPAVRTQLVFHIDSVHVLKQKPLCIRQTPFVSTIYCLHNTGFQFVTNCVCCVSRLKFESNILISRF